MSFTITSSEREEYVLIKSVGEVTGKEDLFLHAELVYREAIKYSNHKKLIDATHTRFPLNMYHYYDQVEFFSENFPPEIRSFKLCVVLSPEFEEMGRFWETVAVNRGFEYYAFTSLEAAHKWLIQ